MAADAGFGFESEPLGGTWAFGVNWSGSSQAYGLTDPIEFDLDDAISALDDWLHTLPINRPQVLPIGNDVVVEINPATNAILFALQNDSSMLTKSTQTTELNIGYSRLAMANSAGSLFWGVEARLFNMQLSRISVRFGDITNSEELYLYARYKNLAY